MRSQVRLAEVLDAAVGGVLGDVHKVMPGIVMAYHPSSAPSGGNPGSPARVDVQPAVHDVREDTETGERVSEPFPVFPEVPLAFPKGGGRSIRWALSPGDKVLLLSFDLDPTAHFGTGQAEDPPDARRHGGGYWVALPFDLTDGGALDDPGSDLVIDGASIALGFGATDALSLASKVDAALTKLQVRVDAILGVLTASPGNPAVQFTPVAGVSTPIGTLASVASAVVKSK